MSINIAHLLQRVAACGYAVSLQNGAPSLVPLRSECIMPKPLLKALKEHRAAVIDYLTTCTVCGRDVSDNETRERMADPAFCDRGGARDYRDMDGIHHPETQRCPFKPKA